MKTTSRLGGENASVGQPPRRRAGLSFLEILILLSVATVLGGVLLLIETFGALGGGGSSGKVTAAQFFATRIVQQPLLDYNHVTGSYPTTAQGLQALIVAPPGLAGWNGPYLYHTLTTVPLDPWRHPYHCAYPSTHGQVAGKYDIWSNGPTGRDGAPDTIGNWNPPE
jgi:general secretion pathway protein G